MRYGWELLREFNRIGGEFSSRVRERFAWAYPDEGGPDLRPDGYLWARTVRCPYCEGLVPLSPNWRLAPDGTGVRLIPDVARGPGSAGRVCRFEIVKSVKTQSAGTVARGTVQCPYPDCGRITDDEAVRQQARDGLMGEQLYAIVFKRRVVAKTKTGRTRDKWERGYRAPRPEDDVSALVAERFAERLSEWESMNVLPSEEIESAHPKYDPVRWGITKWRDFFSLRQLLGHGTGAVGEVVGIGGWRNLRLVQSARAGVVAPAEITP